MIKTFSYSEENNDFIDLSQNNHFFEGEDTKILYFYKDKESYLEFVKNNNLTEQKNLFYDE
jgi:hypothetical protein|tara:strand:- start:183 stop:365 length:183 start_codon:yes stop_codon:yes gene_type:complete